MKKTLLLTLLAVLTTALPAHAYKFEVDGIYYNILSEEDLTCEVTKYSYNSYNITIPSSVTYSGKTFTVTAIGESAFSSCYSLTSVEIPNSVTSIGKYAFYFCKSLTSVVIPNSVTSIERGAFDCCSSLTSIEIPNSVTSIGDCAFYSCSSLTSVEIPNSVTSIEWGVFRGCSSLTSFTGKFASDDHRCLIVDGVLKAFAPAGLTTYSIPNSVTSIEVWAFYYCESLTSVVIPNSVTSIGSSAFEGCKSLTSIEIPNSVTSIGEEAFDYCKSLTSVEIPNSVTSIENRAFSSCSSLTSVVIPNSVTSIGEYTFYNCTSLTSVVIPNSVTSIGNDAFYKCSSLTQITSLAVTPPTIQSNTFEGVSKTLSVVKVPEESVDAYKSANYWKQFGKIEALSGGEGGEDPEIKQCALPTITLADGKLIVTSETEGSTCYTSITTDDYKGIDTNDPIELTGIYNISAYAHADGYSNSETALATLVWVMPEGDATGLLCMEAKKPIVIRSHNNTIIISGTEKLEKVELYTIAGLQLASVTADADQTVIPHTLAKGEIVIVKFGNRSIKITI